MKINGREVLSISDKDLSYIRNKEIGFIFQDPKFLPEFTVLENTCLPGLINNKKNKAYIENIAENLLIKLNIQKHINSKIDELSGGEKQRLSVARALINDPKIIFADEPSGNLDKKNADNLHQLFFFLNKELKKTFLIVTHNIVLANMADEKMEIKNGLILKK